MLADGWLLFDRDAKHRLGPSPCFDALAKGRGSLLSGGGLAWNLSRHYRRFSIRQPRKASARRELIRFHAVHGLAPAIADLGLGLSHRLKVEVSLSSGSVPR